MSIMLRVLGLIWCCCLSVSANAEIRSALIIGNSAYAHAPRLANPGRDATTLAKALREAGFQSVKVEFDLGRDGLIKALQQFQTIADSSDWAAVYYAGHGIEVNGLNYLVPIDARLASDRDVEDETISLAQVQRRLEGARKLRMIILDACRDNPFLVTMKRNASSRSIGRGLGRPEIPQSGSLVAYSAAAGQIASDGLTNQGNSPYVAALVKNLAVPDVEVNLFFRRVRAEVLQATGRTQEPATYESLPEERFIFRPGGPSAPVAPTPDANASSGTSASSNMPSSLDEIQAIKISFLQQNDSINKYDVGAILRKQSDGRFLLASTLRDDCLNGRRKGDAGVVYSLSGPSVGKFRCEGTQYGEGVTAKVLLYGDYRGTLVVDQGIAVFDGQMTWIDKTAGSSTGGDAIKYSEKVTIDLSNSQCKVVSYKSVRKEVYGDRTQGVWEVTNSLRTNCQVYR